MLGMKKKGFNQSIGILNKTPLLAMLHTLYGDLRLENLPIPLILQATDLLSGEGIEMDSGSLVEAVYASCAAYPFLPTPSGRGAGCSTAPFPPRCPSWRRCAGGWTSSSLWISRRN